MRGLDADEFTVAEMAAMPLGTRPPGQASPREREAGDRMILRGQCAVETARCSCGCGMIGGVIVLTPDGREALRIARAVRALEGVS